MAISVREMDVFRCVMQSGSVTNAAVTMNISQPAVSRMLRLRLGRRLQALLLAFKQPETETLLRLLQHTADRRLGNVQGGGRIRYRARLHHTSEHVHLPHADRHI